MDEQYINLIKYIVTMLVFPFILYGLKGLVNQWNEKKKLDLKKIEAEFTEQLKKQSNLSSEKQKILFAWQSSINASIKKRQLNEVCGNRSLESEYLETDNNDRIRLHLDEITKKYDNTELYYLHPIGELISQTIVFSFDNNVHKYVKKLMEATYSINTPNSETRNEDFMVYQSLIYYYLSKEWLGFAEGDIEKDYLLKLYLKDYSINLDNSESIEYMKRKIKKY